MLKILSCIALEHDYRALALAALVCVLGSVMAMRLFARTRRSTGAKQAVWLFLAGVVAGSAVWTTHFVAMLGYQPSLDHGYEPFGTLISLFLAIGLCTAGMIMASSTRTSVLIEGGGIVLGLGIVVMHYVGINAYKITGRFEWDWTLVAASVVLACFFGAIAMNRIARPVTRFCKYGGALALILAIVSMHFTAMGALVIVPDLSVAVPAKVIPDEFLGIGVVAVMTLVMGTGISSYIIDSFAQDEALKRYRHLALHDTVTGLPNRAYLASRLSAAIVNANDDTSRVAVIAIDLDRFKDINDVHGHAAGDHVLRTLAEKLSRLLGQGEFLARTGGDEFVAVKQNLYTRGQAVAFAETIRAAICEPIAEQDRVLTVGASIGISLFPDNGAHVEELIGRADLAMYRAKLSSLDKVCLYDPSMDEAGRVRSALGMELRHAVERGEMELYYQPQIDVASRRLIGYEALLRWNHPERGLVSPADFIPIAEETGLILPIGEWVLMTACREAAQWALPLKVAVNVAPAQFAQSDLPRIVHGCLVETGLPASRLELEITESSIIGDHQHALHLVRQIKALGVTIAMDDFGTGYSSLSTLQSFPFDKIKIDRSFVQTVCDSDQSAAIVLATIVLARGLGIPVLAEGVESAAHLEFLGLEGCQEAQGYLIGKPMPVSKIREQTSAVAPAPETSGKLAPSSANVVELRKVA